MKKEKEQSEFSRKFKAGWKKANEIWGKIKHVFDIIGKVLYHLRKPALTVPVVLAALKVYAYAQENMPEVVGILLKEDGSYYKMMDKAVVINSCMGLTAICLGLMFLSRRTIYPWLISLFTLVLPILVIVTNIFPA